MHTVTGWLDHNRYIAMALVMVAVTAVWLVGCQATTESVLQPGSQIGRAELEREAAEIVADFEAKSTALELAQADLERQEAARAAAVQVLTGLAASAASGTLTPAGGINAAITLLGLIGLGAVADNRRKDAVLKKKANDVAKAS